MLTWLTLESWFNLILGITILIAFLSVLRVLTKHISRKENKTSHKALNRFCDVLIGLGILTIITVGIMIASSSIKENRQTMRQAVVDQVKDAYNTERVKITGDVKELDPGHNQYEVLADDKMIYAVVERGEENPDVTLRQQ